jgi:hypothetical protein
MLGDAYVGRRPTLVFCKQSLLCYTDAWKRDNAQIMESGGSVVCGAGAQPQDLHEE